MSTKSCKYCCEPITLKAKICPSQEGKRNRETATLIGFNNRDKWRLTSKAMNKQLPISANQLLLETENINGSSR